MEELDREWEQCSGEAVGSLILEVFDLVSSRPSGMWWERFMYFIAVGPNGFVGSLSSFLFLRF